MPSKTRRTSRMAPPSKWLSNSAGLPGGVDLPQPLSIRKPSRLDVTRGVGSWAKVVLIVVLVAVMVVPTGALELTGGSRVPKNPTQLSTLELAVGKAVAHPFSGGNGWSVSRTLDVCNGTLIPGNWIPSGCTQAKPYAVAYDSAKGEVFLAESGSSAVKVISDLTDHVVATVPVGTNPQGVAYDSGKGEIFVACGGANSVSVISDATNQVVANVTVGTNPGSIAYDAGKSELFVANWGGGPNTVSVISDTSNQVVATVVAGPGGVGYDAARSEVFVANWNTNSVAVISDSNNTVVAHVAVGSGGGVVVDGRDGSVFLANGAGNDVSVVSDTTNLGIATIPVGPTPEGVAYDNGTDLVFVSNCNCSNGPQGTGNVSVVSGSTNSQVASIWVGIAPEGAVYDSGNGEVYIANSGSGSVSILSYGSSSPALSGVSVSPFTGTLQVGTSENFTASVTCNGGTCPSGTTYSWSLTSKLATLSSSSGNPVKVTAGSAAGTATLYANATLNGVTKETTATITIVASSSSPPPNSTIPTSSILIGVVVVVIAIVATLVLLRKRKGGQVPTGTPPTASPPGSPPPPP